MRLPTITQITGTLTRNKAGKWCVSTSGGTYQISEGLQPRLTPKQEGADVRGVLNGTSRTASVVSYTIVEKLISTE